MIPVLLALVLGSLGCRSQAPPAVEESPTLYTCGMHPQVVHDHPGDCPICGMDLTPMGARTTDGTVEISPGVIQQMGVETAPVERTTVFRHLRTLGQVEVGEDEVSVVNLRYSGWAERVYVDRTGDEVKAGQTLFAIYSPELVAAQEEYLLALDSQGPEAALTRSARRKLELWNVAPRDLRKLQESREVSRTLPVRAPQDGFILHKDLVEGARVTAGEDLYRIGNLERIWVTAEVYEHDAPWVDVGQPAQLELTHVIDRALEGTVAYIYPTLDTTSRTLKVRLEFDNPGVRLKPGMFATIYVQYRRKDDTIAVPTSAILFSGRRQIVFVAHDRGRFEPREIQVGLQGDHRMTEVTSGLTEGEVVVTSGQFLLDSESQLQEALQKIVASSPAKPSPPETVWSCPMHPEVLADDEGRCPECGMFLEERPGTPDELQSVHGKQATPGAYTCPMHPEIVEEEPGRCPKCGMFLEQIPQPGQDHAGHDHSDHSDHGGHP